MLYGLQIAKALIHFLYTKYLNVLSLYFQNGFIGMFQHKRFAVYFCEDCKPFFLNANC